MLRIFFLFIALYRLCLANSSEEFYILPMGQGNAQLIIYNADQSAHRVGILYDMGSKSLQTHPKFTMKGDWKIRFKPIFKSDDYNEEQDLSAITPKRIRTASIETPGTTEQKANKQQMANVHEGLHDFIKDLLTGLKHLFIFVSHTDVDHINKINNDTIPQSVPITVFLCGDWFGDTCSKSADGDDPSTAIKETLQFFLGRSYTTIEFPYYWGFKVGGKNFSEAIKELYGKKETI